MRPFSWIIVLLALLNVAFLASLPLFSASAASQLEFSRPEAIPKPEHLPKKREKPLVPVEELHEELQLPRVDTSPTDEHSRAAIAAYEDGDYERAFHEAVLSLDSTPLDENKIYEALMTKLFDYPRDPTKQIGKPNGRFAIEAIDQALQPALSEGRPHTAERLNNAAAMMILYLHTAETLPPFVSLDHAADPPETLMGPWAAQELAYQAADLRSDYCPALLNLTLFDGINHGDSNTLIPVDTDYDLDHAGQPGALEFSEPLGPWTKHYPATGCKDPALLYYLAQNEIFEAQRLKDESVDIQRGSSTLRLADRLLEFEGWAGLAHSVKGDFYFWSSAYALERTDYPRPFGHRHYLKRALREYEAASKLQPDDPGIRHGKALVYLEQGKAKTRDDVDEAALNDAIRELEMALQAAPNSPRLWQTLIEAHEEKGDHETVAQLQRMFLSTERSAPTPLTLVPYSPISHGADFYSDLRYYETAGGGAFIDEEVITPYVPTEYVFGYSYWGSREWNPLFDIRSYRSALQHYSLVSNDLLSGDYAAFEEDLRKAPDAVRKQDPDAKLMIGIQELLSQPEAEPLPTAQTQSAINDYIAAYVNVNDYFSQRANVVDSNMLKDKKVFEEISLQDHLAHDGIEYIGQDDELTFPQNGFFYWNAANFFRQNKKYDAALRIYKVWEKELERDTVADERKSELQKLIGETLFLEGRATEATGSKEQDQANYHEAFDSFSQAAKLRPGWPPYMVRQAFLQEQLGHYDEAEELYRSALQAVDEQVAEADTDQLDLSEDFYSSSYYAAKHLGDVLLRGAENARRTAGENGSKELSSKYEEAAQKYRRALSTTTGPSETAAVNNLGMALLRAGRYDQSISVLETLVRPSSLLAATEAECVGFWEAAGEAVPTGCRELPELPGTPDIHNPVFYLNLGWAYQLDGQPRGAEENYLDAVRSDGSFHPALNDLGVLATEEHDLEEAKSYFQAALDAKRTETGEDYAHAAHNLGVTLLESGPRHFLAAQDYLARAAAKDPSIGEASYDYIPDNELYFLNLSLASNVPPDWRFAKEAENSTGIISGFMLLSIALGYARTEIVQETIVERFLSFVKRFSSNRRIPRLLRKLRVGLLKFMKLGVPAVSGWWVTPLALLVSTPAIVTVMGWDLWRGLWRGDSEAKWLMLGVLFYLVVVTLLVHHAGHALAALWLKMRVREAPWPAGIVQALAMVLIGGPAVAPVPASVVEGGEERERERALIFLAGPVASMLFAALLFVLFLTSHISLLKLGAILNLAVAAVSLLLLPPLDGGMVGKGRYTRLLLWVGTILAVLWVLVYFSNQFYCAQSPGDHCWGIWF